MSAAKLSLLLKAWDRIRELARRPILRAVVGGLVIALAFGYLGLILVRNWGQLASYEWHVDSIQAALAFAYYSAALAAVICAWQLIMQRLTSVRSWKKNLKYYVYTNLLRRLPIPLFYVVGRAYLYEREGVAKSVSATLSLLEWALIVLSGLLVYAGTLPFQAFPSIWRSPWVLGGVLIIGTVLVQPRTLRAILRLLGRGESSVSFSVWELLLWLLLYGLAWIGGGLVAYAAIRSFYPLAITELPAVIGAWVLSGLVTTVVLASAVGLGVKEVTLTVLLASLMPAPLAVVVALLTRVGLTLFDLVWGAIGLLVIR